MGLRYETFDDATEVDAPGPSPEWVLGHGAGLAEGLAMGAAEATAATESRADALSAEMAQALADTAFGYAEARGQVLASLGPLFQAIGDRLLPALAAEALTPWLADALMTAAAEDSARPLVIHVHPDRLGTVQACLPGDAATGGWGPSALRADPGLGFHDARLEAPDRETALDLGACLAALREALSAIPKDPARKARHA